MRIQIIDTPPGEAPQAVREAWIGMIFDADGKNGWRSKGPLSDRNQSSGGYVVDGGQAIAELEEVDPQAAMWWKLNDTLEYRTEFIFSPDVCQELPE